MTGKTKAGKGKVHLLEEEFSNLLRILVRTYRFHNDGKPPTVIIVPMVAEVDGIPIEYEDRDKPKLQLPEVGANEIGGG